ncbi:MAG: hypothetical protein E7408_00790 [Ruminococcaceae bacterium]|nr:hypothetical protein [Oscillospiraceae bacterium]
MSVSVTNQFHIFLLSLAGGALAGVFFDLFRAFRRLVRSGSVWVGVQDLLFWLLAAAAAFLFLYRTNYGQPRWYIFCGILLGALFYHLLLRDVTVRFFLALARLIGLFLFTLAKIVVFPFRLLYRLFHPVALFLWRPCRAIWRFFRRKIHSLRAKTIALIRNLKKIQKMY